MTWYAPYGWAVKPSARKGADTTATIVRAEAQLLAARLLLDLAAAVDVVDWAAEQVSDDVLPDSTAMVTLAALYRDALTGDVSQALDLLLVELGVPRLGTGEAAVAIVVRGIAADLVLGLLSPIAAARSICRAASLPSEYPSELADFRVLASEWEDSPERRVHFDDELRQAAQTLLAR